MVISLEATPRYSAKKKVFLIFFCKTHLKFKRKELFWSLVLNKVAGWGHNMNMKLLIHLHFVKTSLITKSKLFKLFMQCVLTHPWKVW